MDDGRLFRVLTLLLAIVEQGLVALEESDAPEEELRSALVETNERLYEVLASRRFRTAI